MNNQTELQLNNQEVREERTAKNLAKKLENMCEIEENNHKKITQSSELLGRELEKLKFDVGDMIDNKFENIMLKMDQETKNLKETFERIS